MAEPMIVYLGNRTAVDVRRADDGQLVRTALPEGRRCTTVRPPAGVTLGEAFTSITASGGVWRFHSDGAPAWVASTSPMLAALLGEHYGCEVRTPDPDDVRQEG